MLKALLSLSFCISIKNAVAKLRLYNEVQIPHLRMAETHSVKAQYAQSTNLFKL